MPKSGDKKKGTDKNKPKKSIKEKQEQKKQKEVTLPASTPLPDGTWPKFYQISNDFGLAAKPLYKIHSGADLFVTHLSIDSLFVPDGSTCGHTHATERLTGTVICSAEQGDPGAPGQPWPGNQYI